MARKNNSREKILDAVEDVMAEEGAAHVSLDVVAQRAGVSKGGLMYNFPTKKALLEGMMTRLVEQHAADQVQEEQKLKKTKGRVLKAMLRACQAPNARRDRIGLAVLAALASNKELLAPLKKAIKDNLDQIKASGLPYEKAVLISLASDGLMFWDLLGCNVFANKERQKIQKMMYQLVDDLEG